MSSLLERVAWYRTLSVELLESIRESASTHVTRASCESVINEKLGRMKYDVAEVERTDGKNGWGQVLTYFLRA